MGFLETLATMPESDERWRGLSAGMLALLVADHAGRHGTADLQAVRFARDELRRVWHIPRAARLRCVLDAIEARADDRRHWRAAIAASLMPYAVELHSDGLFLPAIDVFGVVADLSIEDVELYGQATLRRAFALRLLKRFDDAQFVYEHLGAIARESRNRALELEARLGMGKLLIDRGNIPAAEPVIQEVIARARTAREKRIMAKARIDAACIAGMRNDPLGVIEQSFLALRGLAQPSTDYDRALRNISQALRELGCGDVARRVSRYVADHGCDADQRVGAMLLLYHLEIDAGAILAADHYRRALADVSFTPKIEAQYQEALARDLAARGDWAGASAAVARLLDIASTFKMAELVMRSDHAMLDLERHRVPAVYAYRPQRLESRHEERRLEPIRTALYSLCPA